MAVYSFTGSGGDFGSASGLGGWLTGIGPAFRQGMSTGIGFNNAIRDMNSQNYLQPYILSAAANRLTADRLSSLWDARFQAGLLDAGTQQMNTPAAGVSVAMNTPAPAEQQQRSAEELGRMFGMEAAAPVQTDPFLSGGLSDTARLLGLGPYMYRGY